MFPNLLNGFVHSLPSAGKRGLPWKPSLVALAFSRSCPASPSLSTSIVTFGGQRCGDHLTTKPTNMPQLHRLPPPPQLSLGTAWQSAHRSLNSPVPQRCDFQSLSPEVPCVPLSTSLVAHCLVSYSVEKTVLRQESSPIPALLPFHLCLACLPLLLAHQGELHTRFLDWHDSLAGKP